MNWTFFSTMPSTNVRISASILMAMGTFGLMAVTVMTGKPWEPSEIWLGFLVLWAGLDVTQFIGKRSTNNDYVAAKQGIPPPDPAKPPEVGT